MMGPRKGKKTSAYQIHRKQQNIQEKISLVSKQKMKKARDRKKKGKTKVFIDKKTIIEETQSDHVTIVSLQTGSTVSNKFMQEVNDFKEKKGKNKQDVGKVSQLNKMKKHPQKEDADREFVVVADDASVMLVEAQRGSCSKDTRAGSIGHIPCRESIPETLTDKRKKRKRKKKNDDNVDDFTAVMDSEGLSPPFVVDWKTTSGLDDCEQDHLNTYRKQRNLPKFESKYVRKNYDKNLVKEIGLVKEQVDRRRRMLEDMCKPVEVVTTDAHLDSYHNVDGSEEQPDVGSEYSDISDSDNADVSGEDILDSLEKEETLFKVFGHGQVEAGSCGAFGSGSSSFQFQGQKDLNDNEQLEPRSKTKGKLIQDGGKSSRKSRRQNSKSFIGDEPAALKSATGDAGNSNKLKCISLSLPKEEAAIVVLAHPQELCIQGKALVTMVTGEMDIMGHRLKPDQSYKMYSPLSNSYAVLKTIGGKTNIKEVSKKVSTLIGYEQCGKQQCDSELKAFKSEHCVSFVLRPLDSEAHDFISSMSPYNGLFTIRSDEPLEHNVHLLPLGIGLFSREFVMRPWMTLTNDIQKILDLWETMLARGDKSASHRAPVIIVCGGKNSGKSTLNRHLINAALNSLTEVSYLELDVGQTEFSPPGCVALYHVTQPVLGPPFTHLRKAKSVCYYGSVTASVNVSLYTQCVEYVFAAHKGDNPLIVNTMGWNKDIGLKLLVDVLHITSPDIVVQINTYKPTDNFPPITSHFKMAEEGWLYNRQDQHEQQDVVNKPEADGHELCVVQTPVRKMQEKFITWTAADHRNVTLLSYFCDGLHPGQSILSLSPYTVPWPAVAVHICNAPEIKPSQTLLVLNGSVVGLCQADLPEVTTTDDSNPRLLTSFPMCQCLGFGLVRGIDPVTKLLYIVTPVTQNDLDKVNVFIKGSLTLPEQVTRQQKTIMRKPYWDVLTPSLGSWKTNYRDKKMRRPGAVFRSRYK